MIKRDDQREFKEVLEQKMTISNYDYFRKMLVIYSGFTYSGGIHQ